MIKVLRDWMQRSLDEEAVVLAIMLVLGFSVIPPSAGCSRRYWRRW